MKAIILARVSTKEQQEEGQSIPAQTRRMVDYCCNRSFEDPEIFQITESSSKDTRKEFEKVIKFIKESKQPVALVVETIDRLQRSFRESVTLDDFRREGKLDLHFVRENLVLNKDSNSADLLRWDMGVMFARSYVLQLSDNVKRSREQKLRNREWPGKAPLGYKNVIRDGVKDIEPDEQRAPLVREIFELYASGKYSMKGLAKLMKEKGLTNNSVKGRAVTTSQIEATLKNPFYYGIMVTEGKEYPHRYPPLVSLYLFNKVKKVAESWNRQHFKRTNNPYIFRGLIKCSDCGCAISPYIKKGKYIYYRCTNFYGHCHNVFNVKEEIIIEQVKKVFDRLKLPEEAVERLKSELKAIHESKSVYHKESVARIQKELNTITARYEKMYIDKIDGSITTDNYDKLLKQFKERENDLILQLEDHTKGNQGFYITANTILNLTNRAFEIFESSEPEEKTQLLKFILQNLELKGKKLVYELKNPFQGIAEYQKTGNWLWGPDSNRRPSG